MTDATPAKPVAGDGPDQIPALACSPLLEVDTRLLGMVVALAVIWIGFNVMSGRQLPHLPQPLEPVRPELSIAIMATGMVLIIVSRNIDLSVGSLLGFLGYTMAMVQTVWIPKNLGLGFDQPYTWIIALAVGIVLGAADRRAPGLHHRLRRVPAFIVTLGGFLVWRGLIFWYAKGQTIAPMDKNFFLLGGGPTGSAGEWPSWILGSPRLRRRSSTWRSRAAAGAGSYGFPVRPTWALVTVIGAACAAVLGAVWVANNYFWPSALATQYAESHGITEPPGGLQIPVGIAFPVLIMIGVTLVMTFIATRRRFGRYVYAIGGNPEAAELGGINVRRTIMLTFVLIGILVAISAAIQTARLNAAVTNLGVQNELDVIAAAVIGGTSFTGGIGTIAGAVLGAVVMQSLRSGMVLLNVDSPTQDIVVGIVLVAAVGLDSFLRRRGTR